MGQAKDINEWFQLDKLQLVSLFGSKAREGEGPDESIPERRGWRVFLSYARADEVAMGKLYDRLSASGFAPWVDVRSIHPGEDWLSAIDTAIRECGFLFYVCPVTQWGGVVPIFETTS